jgi:hypothetical protein
MAITAPSWAVSTPQHAGRVSPRVPRSRSLPLFAPFVPPGTRRAFPARTSIAGAHGYPGSRTPRRETATAGVSTIPGVLPSPAGHIASLRSSRAPSRSYQTARSVRRSRHPRYGVIAVLAVLIATLTLVAAGISAQASRMVTEGPAQSLVTVHQGDSLWSVATRSMPNTDPRAAVREIRELNGLKGAALTPGQQLLIPAS